MTTTRSARLGTEPRRGSVPLTIALALVAPLSIVGLAAAYGSYGRPVGLGVLVVATAVLSAGLGRLAGSAVRRPPVAGPPDQPSSAGSSAIEPSTWVAPSARSRASSWAPVRTPATTGAPARVPVSMS